MEREQIYTDKVMKILSSMIKDCKKKRRTWRLYQAVPELGIEGKKKCHERVRNYKIDVAVVGKRVLDIGSNMGMMSIECSKAGASSVHGIEIEEPYFDTSCVLKEFYGFSNVNFYHTSFKKHFDSMPSGSYDVILSLAVHRWVAKFDKIGNNDFFKKMAQLLSDNGVLILESHRRDKRKGLQKSLEESGFSIVNCMESDDGKRTVFEAKLS